MENVNPVFVAELQSKLAMLIAVNLRINDRTFFNNLLEFYKKSSSQMRYAFYPGQIFNDRTAFVFSSAFRYAFNLQKYSSGCKVDMNLFGYPALDAYTCQLNVEKTDSFLIIMTMSLEEVYRTLYCFLVKRDWAQLLLNYEIPLGSTCYILTRIDGEQVAVEIDHKSNGAYKVDLKPLKAVAGKKVLYYLQDSRD